MAPFLMTVEQAAERYGVCRRTIYNLMCMPDAPKRLKMGRRTLLPVEEFDRFMKEAFS